jgi:hypothetical protein
VVDFSVVLTSGAGQHERGGSGSLMVMFCHVIGPVDKTLDQNRKRGFQVREDLPGGGPRHLDPTRHYIHQTLLGRHQLFGEVFTFKGKELRIHSEGTKGT